VVGGVDEGAGPQGPHQDALKRAGRRRRRAAERRGLQVEHGTVEQRNPAPKQSLGSLIATILMGSGQGDPGSGSTQHGTHREAEGAVGEGQGRARRARHAVLKAVENAQLFIDSAAVQGSDGEF